MKKWLRRIWCELWHVRVGETVVAECRHKVKTTWDGSEYAGILWTCKQCRRKYIDVEWSFDDEHCPKGYHGNE